MTKTIRILSIDGGGIRGIIAATVLRELLGERRAKDAFHMIAGTSTGGILACGLAKPNALAPQEMLDLYVQHGGEIFGRSWYQRVPGYEKLAPKYSAAALEKHLLRILAGDRLSDVDGVDLIVPSYAIELPKPRDPGTNDETRAPLFFRSWQAKGEDNRPPLEYDFFLRDVARATSAAPSYFPPAEIYNRKGERFGMIDGGVFANNPTMCALTAAYRRYGMGHKYVVVSLGTGFLQRPIPLNEAKGWGQLGWLQTILSVMMDGNSDTVCAQAEQALGKNHYRFDIPLGVYESDPKAANDDFDDGSPDNIRRLVAKAQALVADKKSHIVGLRQLLHQPRDEMVPASTAAA